MGSLQWSPTPSSFVPRGSAALRLSANCLNVDGIGATDKLRGRTFAKMCCLTSFFFFFRKGFSFFTAFSYNAVFQEANFLLSP